MEENLVCLKMAAPNLREREIPSSISEDENSSNTQTDTSNAIINTEMDTIEEPGADKDESSVCGVYDESTKREVSELDQKSQDILDSCMCTFVLSEAGFTCASCSGAFTKICCLHEHLKKHASGGSYYYDHVSQTAFPKYDSFCRYTQTEDVGEHRSDESVIIEIKEERDDVNPDISMKTYRTNLHFSFADSKKFLVNRRNEHPRKCRYFGQKKSKKVKSKQREKIEGKINIEQETSDSLCKTRKDLSKHKRNTKPRGDSQYKTNALHGKPLANGNQRQTRSASSKNKDSRKKIEKVMDNADEEMNFGTTNEDTAKEHLNVSVDTVPFKKRKISSTGSGKQKIKTENKECNELLDSEGGAIKTVHPESCRKKKSGDGLNGIKNKETDEGRHVSEKDLSPKKAPEIKPSNLTPDIDNPFPVKKRQAKLWKCDICGLHVPRRKWNFHQKNHRGERPFICEKCGKTFTNDRQLRRHLVTHADVKPFRCSMCPGQFCSRNEFNVHLAGHADYRPYVCNVCDKRFLCNTSLLTHQANIHMGITHYACDQCDKRFFKKSSLNSHVATHYEATLQCKFCVKKFRDKTGLKRHEGTHTGVKNYICHVCSHGFIQSTPFWVHMEKRHGMCRKKLKEKVKELKETNRRSGKATDVILLPEEIDKDGLLMSDASVKQKDINGNQSCNDVRLSQPLDNHGSGSVDIIPEKGIVGSSSQDNLNAVPDIQDPYAVHKSDLKAEENRGDDRVYSNQSHILDLPKMFSPPVLSSMLSKNNATMSTSNHPTNIAMAQKPVDLPIVSHDTSHGFPPKSHDTQHSFQSKSLEIVHGLLSESHVTSHGLLFESHATSHCLLPLSSSSSSLVSLHHHSNSGSNNHITSTEYAILQQKAGSTAKSPDCDKEDELPICNL